MVLTPTQKRNVRAAIAGYCETAEAHREAWHYSQARPFKYGPPEGPASADCSSFVARVFKWAGDAADVDLADPTGGEYGGYGWTGSMEHWLRTHGHTVTTQGYLVGDIALYGPGGHAGAHGHTTVCRERGSGAASVWSSHGREAGPEERRLRYRADLVGVWRHPALL